MKKNNINRPWRYSVFFLSFSQQIYVFYFITVKNKTWTNKNKPSQHRLVRYKWIINNKSDVDNWNAWFFGAMTPVATVFDLYAYSIWRLAINEKDIFILKVRFEYKLTGFIIIHIRDKWR